MRVVDVSGYGGGPMCAQLLGAMGATVLKVERPPHGDPERGTRREMFDAHNRGKRSAVLDLRADDDRNLFRQLVADAHVVVHNYRPQVAQRLGLDLPTLERSQPSIIVVVISGFGPTGPRADEPAYELQLRALTGELDIGRDAEGRVQESWTLDYPAYGYAAALYAALGVMGARLEPAGHGVQIEVPLLGAGYTWMFAALMTPAFRQFARDDVRHVYETRDGRALAIMVPMADQFARLCTLVDRPDLVDAAGDDPFTWQYDHAREMNDALSAAFATADGDVWIERLRAAQVPVAPVLSASEVRQEPQLVALDLGVATPDTAYRLPILGLPTTTLGPAPELDADGPAVRAQGWHGIEARSH